MKLRAVRGTHDLYGDDIEKYNLIKKIVSQNAKIKSFNQIETPIFEFTELFSKPLGAQSDVVLKEMYTFKDRNDDLLTLRPEYTTPMIRSAITNSMLNNLPLKIYSMGPIFRRERPQKGRFRQFNQINFEILGTKDFLADLELIVVANKIINLILPNVDIKLNLNSLGSKNNLIQFKKILSKYFIKNKKKLSKESVDKIETNPIRILDSKQEDDIEVSKSAPSIIEFISKEDLLHFEEIKNGLKTFNINFEENHRLVRGLDYYCNTVFEFKTDKLGSQDTLLGGGRYDGLVKTLGGPDTDGIGWAAGVERIMMLMDNITSHKENIHIAISNEKFKNHFIKITKYLDEHNISYYWNYKYNLKKSLSKANLDKIKYVIIIGYDEFEKNYFTIKNLISGEQFKLEINDIKNFLNDKS